MEKLAIAALVLLTIDLLFCILYCALAEIEERKEDDRDD
jgi:hypothetical protein